MWFEFFVLGTFWFWVFVLGFFSLMLYLLEEKESGSGATTLLIFALAMYWFFGSYNIFKDIFNYILNNPFMTFSYVVAYFLFGTIYGIYKGYKFCQDCYMQVVHYLDNKEKYKHKPDIQDHWDDFVRRAAYWPFSIIWTIIEDPIRAIFRVIGKILKRMLDKIADNIFE
jgi:hypothetical protein